MDNLELLRKLAIPQLTSKMVNKDINSRELVENIIKDLHEDLLSFYSDYDVLTKKNIELLNIKPYEVLPDIIKLHLKLVDSFTNYLQLMIFTNTTITDISNHITNYLQPRGLTDSEYYENPDTLLKLYHFANYMYQEQFERGTGRSIILSTEYPACNKVSYLTLNAVRMSILDILHATWLFNNNYRRDLSFQEHLVDALLELSQLYVIVELNPTTLINLSKEINSGTN